MPHAPRAQDPPQRRAVVSAVYGIVAFLDVPLVYLSVKLLPDIHPSGIELNPAMRAVLLYWFVPVTMLNAGLIAGRFGLWRGGAAAPPPARASRPSLRRP